MTHSKPTQPVYTIHRSHLRFWLIGTVLFFVFLYLIRGILLPFVVGMLAAYFLDPAVRQLRQRGWSRGGASAFITVLFCTLAATLCSVVIPLLITQLSALAAALPGYVHLLQEKYGEEIRLYVSSLSPEQVDSVRTSAGTMGGSLAQWLGKIIPDMLQSGLAVLNLLSLVFLTPVVIFYLLRDWDQFIIQCDRMLPRDHAETIRAQFRAIDQTLSGFIRGQTNVCLIMATYYGIALSLFGLNFGLGMGILTGLLLFIPFVGYALCFAASVVIALFQYGWGGDVAGILAIYGVGAVLESGVITPRLVGGKVGLHPIWIIFGMLAGAALFGFVGILISLPVTAVIGVLVRFGTGQYLKSSVYSSGQ